MPGFIGVQELVVLMIVLLLLFGARRLPELGRSLGKGMREFKDGITGQSERLGPELRSETDETVRRADPGSACAPDRSPS